MQRLNITSLLAKIESTYGVNSTPTGAANAILLAGQPSFTPMEMTAVQRELLRSFYGNAEILPSSIYGKIEISVEAAGSGTAASAPAWGALMRMCAFSETINASAITGTAQVGGSTTSIKLAAGASATDDFYNGMPIAITAGTGNGNSGFIADYDGTSKVATVVAATWVTPDGTSQYSIGANVAYRRISSGFESGTLQMDVDGVRHIFLGARGDWSLSLGLDAIPMHKFALQGLFQAVTDQTMPTSVYTAWQKPLPANRVNTPFFRLHGIAPGLETLDIGANNELAYQSLINGTDQMLVTDAKPTGSISIESVAVATKDFWGIAQNATNGTMALQHGLTAGNKLAITAPAVSLSNLKYGNRNNIAMLNADLAFNPITGNDDFAVVTF